MAKVPFPTATAKMDHDAVDDEDEAVRKSRRWREKIGGSPRCSTAGTSCGCSFRVFRRARRSRGGAGGGFRECCVCM